MCVVFVAIIVCITKRYMMPGNGSMWDWKHWPNMHEIKAQIFFVCEWERLVAWENHQFPLRQPCILILNTLNVLVYDDAYVCAPKFNWAHSRATIDDFECVCVTAVSMWKVGKRHDRNNNSIDEQEYKKRPYTCATLFNVLCKWHCDNFVVSNRIQLATSLQ